MNRLRILLLVMALTGICGCESVNSRHIIGEQIKTYDLSDALNGAWELNGEALYIHQVANGELRVAGLEWNEELQKFETIEFKAILSLLGERTFLNIVRPDDPENREDEVEGTWYQPLLYELGENTLTIRGVSVDAFAGAVDAGKLPGRVDIKRDAEGKVTERHVWLEGEKSAFDAFVRGGKLDELFAEEPATLRRLTDDDE